MAAQVARPETQMVEIMITRYGPQWQCPRPVENDLVEVELEAGLGFQLGTSPSPNLLARAWRGTNLGLPQ